MLHQFQQRRALYLLIPAYTCRQMAMEITNMGTWDGTSGAVSRRNLHERMLTENTTVTNKTLCRRRCSRFISLCPNKLSTISSPTKTSHQLSDHFVSFITPSHSIYFRTVLHIIQCHKNNGDHSYWTIVLDIISASYPYNPIPFHPIMHHVPSHLILSHVQ